MEKAQAIGVAIVVIVVVAGIVIVIRPPTANGTKSVSFQLGDHVVDDFGYVLQYDNMGPREDVVSQLAASRYDLLIIDPYYDPTQNQSWSADEISTIRTGVDSESSKIVLAYVSIGEAESYRPYWNESWDADHNGVPDEGAPSWLDVENPDWPGNYKVRYWDPSWQSIIFGDESSYVDRVLATGFDGVYLDIIDAYEYYEDRGVSDAASKMVEFVSALSTHAKELREDFLVFPQNGEALARRFPQYLDAVDGIGREDVFTLDNTVQPVQQRQRAVEDLGLFLDAGCAVFIIEYPTGPELIDWVYESAADIGALCYVGPRSLDELRVNAGHEPD